jgi:hypothetical protein
LGATCYRAIAGTAPLDAISRSKGILGSTREMLVPAATVGSGRYSGGLLAAVDHALAFDEKARPQTVSEWRKELRGETGTAGAAPPRTAMPAPAPAEKPVPAHAPYSGAGPAPQGKESAVSSASSIGPIAWAVGGAAAGAIAIAVFIHARPAGTDAETKLVAITQKIEEERKSLEAQRKEMEEKRRQEEVERRSLEERRRQEEAKRRQDEQARLEGQKKQDEAKRIKDQQARLAEQQKRAAAEAPKRQARADKVPAPTAIAPPPAVPVGPEPAAVVATAKPEAPRPSPQAEQLARAEGALARGDYAVALESLKPLAGTGNSRAQVRLAEMYSSGLGVKIDYAQAYIWYSLAARGGHASAPTDRERMAKLLQPAQVKQADRIVENWRAR